MIRLFRKIRQRLIIEKKAGNYFLYAFGEVIILIFGILIAIQLNNWNDQRLNNNTEIEILKALKAGLSKDLYGLSLDKKTHNQQIKSSQIILNHFENDKPYHDSLKLHFSNTCIFTVPFINIGAYETLKSKGVGIISNAKLRDSIIDLYDNYYKFLDLMSKNNMNKVGHYENFVLDSRFDQALNDDLEAFLEFEILQGSMIPNNYEYLRRDKEYYFWLQTLKNYSLSYMAILDNTNELVLDIIKDIDKELQILEN